MLLLWKEIELMKLNIGLLIIIVLTNSACKDSKKPETTSTGASTTEIEKIRLINLKGETIDLAKYKGKTVFINFWATWCKPCTQEMPTIKNAIDSLKNEKIEFLFASSGDKKDIADFEAEHHYGFNYVTADNMEDLNIIGLPTTFIFDKDGKKVFSDLGYRKWDDKTNLDLLFKIAETK